MSLPHLGVNWHVVMASQIGREVCNRYFWHTLINRNFSIYKRIPANFNIFTYTPKYLYNSIHTKKESHSKSIHIKLKYLLYA